MYQSTQLPIPPARLATVPPQSHRTVPEVTAQALRCLAAPATQLNRVWLRRCPAVTVAVDIRRRLI